MLPLFDCQVNRWDFQLSPSRLLKESMTHKHSPAIPPTQLVDRSYSAYTTAMSSGSRIPPTQLVDRSYSAYTRGRTPVRNPTNAVGGSFIPSLGHNAYSLSSGPGRQWQAPSLRRLSLNNPPTALVGFRPGRWANPFCRLSMNDPNCVGGIREPDVAAV
jgi:hypothetical protein